MRLAPALEPAGRAVHVAILLRLDEGGSSRGPLDRLLKDALPREDAAAGASVLCEVTLATAGLLDAAWARLGADERHRADRLRRPEHRQSFIFAHAALRTLLSERVAVAPELLRFEQGTYGKPRLAAGLPAVEFSLSYREGLVALALGASPLGIDVERIRTDIDIDGIAGRFFTEAEQAQLHRRKGVARRSYFYALWTRKEAVIKAAGLGIDHGVRCDVVSDIVALPPDGRPAHIGTWTGTGHMLSLCCSGARLKASLKAENTTRHGE